MREKITGASMQAGVKFAQLTTVLQCIKGTLHSVEKNPYTEGLLCLLLHSEGTAIFLCRLTA